jgi:LPS-assembly protein
MTSNFARFPVRRVRNPVYLAATLILLALAPALVAQDTNPGDCAVNGKNGIEGCEPEKSSAAGPEPDPEQSPELVSVPKPEPALDSDRMPDPMPDPMPVAQEFHLDWVPIESVPEELITLECRLCSGRYIDPLADVDKSIDPDEADVKAWAARTELQGDTVHFTGGVDVTQGYRRFQGDTAVVDREQETIRLTGQVSLREPGMLLVGDRAFFDSDSGEATVENGQFVLHADHLRGDAGELERDSEGLIHLHNGTFSYCPPGENDWQIRAKDVELDLDDGLGTARNATVNVGKVPIFYTPWLRFPLDDRRRTGLLWPDFGNDSTGGLDITAPLYLNLAPNYDALYSPRYIEERGVNHELKLRYMHDNVGYWTVGGTYMGHDKHYENQIEEGQSDDRWLGVVKHDGLFAQRWRSRIDYMKASDEQYMKDLEATSLNAQRQTSLLQLGSMDYLGDDWLFNLEVQQFQSLAEDINDQYKKLPQFTGQYRGRGTPFALQPIALGQYSNFDSDEDVVTGQRAYAELGASYPMQWSYGFLEPLLKYRQLNYELTEGRFFTDDSPSAGSALASVDGGLVFERDTRLAGKNLLQTLEPRLYYLYAEHEDQTDQPDFDSAELTFNYNQLFRETRFSGHDRLDDANQLSVGLTTRFIDTETGERLLSASLGQIFYFRDREVRLQPGAQPLDESGSEIAGELSFNPTRHISVRSTLVYDPYSGNMNSGNVQAGYRADNGTIFNIGYSYRRPLNLVNNQQETEQASASAYYPLTNNWRVFGAVNYSVIDNKNIEDMLGVEYDNCCWTVRLMHLRYYDNTTTGFFPDFSNPNLEQEKSTQVQIIFKGMGGFGDRISSILEDMIRGYQEREY